LEEIKRINLEYQAEIQYLISGDRYDGKEDFSVVLQPFLHNFFIPHVGADTSFFSVDCFYFSEQAHAEMAIALWNNMLEPVGSKQVYNNFTYDRSKIRCPSQVHVDRTLIQSSAYLELYIVLYLIFSYSLLTSLCLIYFKKRNSRLPRYLTSHLGSYKLYFIFIIVQTLHLHQDQQPAKSTGNHHHCCSRHTHHHPDKFWFCTNYPCAQVFLHACVGASDRRNRLFAGWYYCSLANSLLLSAPEKQSRWRNRHEKDCFLTHLTSISLYSSVLSWPTTNKSELKCVQS
uniref:Uncharacterized protein n=1 Tax=Anabas testudineus TaxID=64144 RepID=A0A7N6F5X1_ANATE